jgi:hypothetical protein
MFTDLVTKVESNKIVRIFEPNSDKRKEYHKWCRKNGYQHVSYVDIEQKYEEREEYYCYCCSKWTQNTSHESCCGHCPDFIVRCKDCLDNDNCTSDRYYTCVVWHQDGREDEDLKCPHFYKQNNMIAIAKDIESLKDIFKKKGIKRVKTWVKRRDEKYK